MPNPTKLIDITPVTLVSSFTLQTLFLESNRTYTVSHDGENRLGAANTNKIYLFSAISGFPQGITVNDTEGTSNLLSDATSGINTSKMKLLSGRNPITIGPNISTLCYICSGIGDNAAFGATFLVVPGIKQYSGL